MLSKRTPPLDLSTKATSSPSPGANSRRGANSSAALPVAYQQTGDSRGAGARAAGQTDAVGLCHIACSSNIGYLLAKSSIADPPALTLTLTAFREKSTEQKRTTTRVWSSDPTLSIICDKPFDTDQVHSGPREKAANRGAYKWTSRSSVSCNPARSSPPTLSGGFLFSSTPVFMFPHGSPCYPRHPSAWFNFSWKSSSVFLFRSAAVKCLTPQSPTSLAQYMYSHQQRILYLVRLFAEHLMKCLHRCSSNQTLCSLPELHTNSSLSPTNALADPENSPLSVIDGTFLL